MDLFVWKGCPTTNTPGLGLASHVAELRVGRRRQPVQLTGWQLWTRYRFVTLRRSTPHRGFPPPVDELVPAKPWTALLIGPAARPERGGEGRSSGIPIRTCDDM